MDTQAMEVSPERAERVRRAECLPSLRRFHVRALSKLVAESKEDILSLALIADNLRRFLPPGVTLEEVVESLEMSVEDACLAVESTEDMINDKKVEYVLKAAAEGRLAIEEQVAMFRMLQRITVPLENPCKGMDFTHLFCPADKLLKAGQPLIDWQHARERPRKKAMPPPRPSELLPLLNLLSRTPHADLIGASRQALAQYTTFSEAFDSFLLNWPAVNKCLDPPLVVCEGPTRAQILAAVSTQPALLNGQQPVFLTNANGAASSVILTGFANRGEANAAVWSLRSLFRLPAAVGGAMGDSADPDAPDALIWVMNVAGNIGSH
ncbi:hypothetical protein KFL_003010130 [Klebsormidium nitens]|uniref:Uncharacterized protein n=1 Tax=Klebsormidium nitens TaxID=105231 RepID=A0A1Y1ID31_KLENI|nr:hypothetical protein KFL_003010130 [Klebsormidium nitens]|eukprot:GAQ86637.1 hypothetical protein KFL_003010130 [Klebsormidium nitens]